MLQSSSSLLRPNRPLPPPPSADSSTPTPSAGTRSRTATIAGDSVGVLTQTPSPLSRLPTPTRSKDRSLPPSRGGPPSIPPPRPNRSLTASSGLASTTPSTPAPADSSQGLKPRGRNAMKIHSYEDAMASLQAPSEPAPTPPSEMVLPIPEHVKSEKRKTKRRSSTVSDGSTTPRRKTRKKKRKHSEGAIDEPPSLPPRD